MNAYDLKCRLAKASTDAERDELRRLIEAAEASTKPAASATVSQVEQPCVQVEPQLTNQDKTYAIITKQLAVATSKGDDKHILDMGKLLLDYTVKDFQARRKTGRIAEKSAVDSALTVFGSVYLSIVAADASAALPMAGFCELFSRRIDPIVDYYIPYVVAAPRYPADSVEDQINALRSYAPSKGGRHFADLRNLVQDKIGYWASLPDVILLRSYIRLAGQIDKADASLAVSRADTLSDADLEAMGQELMTMFVVSFPTPDPEWREKVAAKLDAAIRNGSEHENQYYEGDWASWGDESKRKPVCDQFLRLLQVCSDDSWWGDARLIVSQYPQIMQAIMADGLDRSSVLARFIDGGLARYPVPVRA